MLASYTATAGATAAASARWSALARLPFPLGTWPDGTITAACTVGSMLVPAAFSAPLAFRLRKRSPLRFTTCYLSNEIKSAAGALRVSPGTNTRSHRVQ